MPIRTCREWQAYAAARATDGRDLSAVEIIQLLRDWAADEAAWRHKGPLEPTREGESGGLESGILCDTHARGV